MQARERDVAGTQAASASQGLFRSVATTLAAKSLAIVGASERARWPSEFFRNLGEFGYPGRIALVNPRQKAVFGQRCFPSLRDLDEPVEHALVIVPAPGVPEILAAAEETGVGSATVYASMLGDGDAPESKARGVWLQDFTAQSTRPAARLPWASRLSRSRPAQRRNRGPPRSLTPAPSLATTRPTSPCAIVTASSITARWTISSKPRSRSKAAGCRKGRASAS